MLIFHFGSMRSICLYMVGGIASSACFLNGIQASSFAASTPHLLAQTTQKIVPKATPPSNSEALRGIRSTTRSKVVLMPVTDKSGQGSSLDEFASEVLNQALLNGGISTVPWFKVNKELKQAMKGGNVYAPVLIGSSSRAVSDENIPELIATSKKLGARYILRPVILSQSQNSEVRTGMTVGMLFGLGGPSVKRSDSATVTVKLDIISTLEEDIIASKTFSGQSQQVTKDRANVLDGITGMQIFSQGSSMDSTKIAFYDTVDKIAEFLQDKTR
jgi:hypothetical protein